MASVSPLYVVNRLGLQFNPARNKTIISLIYADNRESIEQISFAINNTFIPFSAFVVIITCTVILVVRLHSNAEWRMKSVTLVQADNVSNRNQKVARMVIMISGLFIACFVPISILFMAMSMVPGLSIVGKYRNAVIVIGGLGIVLESINSSVNIFIYYRMSSKFRAVFQQLYCAYWIVNRVKTWYRFLNTSEIKIFIVNIFEWTAFQNQPFFWIFYFCWSQDAEISILRSPNIIIIIMCRSYKRCCLSKMLIVNVWFL